VFPWFAGSTVVGLVAETVASLLDWAGGDEGAGESRDENNSGGEVDEHCGGCLGRLVGFREEGKEVGGEGWSVRA
jgi:hypothetical protein